MDFAGPSSASEADNLLEDVLLVEEARETDEADDVAVDAGSVAPAA